MSVSHRKFGRPFLRSRLARLGGALDPPFVVSTFTLAKTVVLPAYAGMIPQTHVQPPSTLRFPAYTRMTSAAALHRG